MKTINVLNPATEKVIGEVPDQTAEEVHKAVSRAKKAYEHWRHSAHESQMLHEIIGRVKERTEVATILTREGQAFARTATKWAGSPVL